MTPTQKEKIGMGMECLAARYIPADRPPSDPDKDREELVQQKAYLDYLETASPQGKPLIAEARACLEGSEAGVCLRKLLHGEKFVPDYHLGELSEDARFQCLELKAKAAENRREQGDAYHLAEKFNLSLFQLITDTSHFKNLTPKEASFLIDEMGAFLYRSFPAWPAKLSAQLRSIPALRQGLNKYPPSSGPLSSLNPFVCENSAAFSRKTLEVPGLEFGIPIFYPKSDRIPWWYYEEALRAEFEVLQAFLTPADLRTLLRPGGKRPDFSLLLGISWQHKAEVFAGCGIDGDTKHGLYSPDRHRVSLLPSFLIVMDKARGANDAPLSAIGGGTTDGDTLFHEVGHALESLFLDDGHRRVLRDLHRWTLEQYSRGKNFAPHPAHLIGGKPYALKNELEFFAQMVSEYLVDAATGSSAKDPAARARARVMNKFFASDGLHPAAISYEEFEQAYRAEGIDLAFDKNGWKLLVRTGFQFAELPNGHSRLVSNDWSLGLGLGYFHEPPAQGGWSYGGALQFDFNPVGKGLEYLEDGKARDKTVRIFDLGISGRFGYAFPALRLQFEPALGYRRIQSSPESFDRFWLGGSAAFFFGGTDVGLGIHFRGSPQGGYAGNLSLQAEFSL